MGNDMGCVLYTEDDEIESNTLFDSSGSWSRRGIMGYFIFLLSTVHLEMSEDGLKKE